MEKNNQFKIVHCERIMNVKRDEDVVHRAFFSTSQQWVIGWISYVLIIQNQISLWFIIEKPFRLPNFISVVKIRISIYIDSPWISCCVDHTLQICCDTFSLRQELRQGFSTKNVPKIRFLRLVPKIRCYVTQSDCWTLHHNYNLLTLQPMTAKINRHKYTILIKILKVWSINS